MMHKFAAAAQTACRIAGLAAGLGAAVAVTGCATPGAPQPPSLNLPAPVKDLTAVRDGDQVRLTWTMPKRNTDKLPLKGAITVQIDRQEDATSPKTGGTAVSTLSLVPGVSGTSTEMLPTTLASGSPRLLRYFVELKNRNGRSAGWSNAATVLAGEAPAPVTGLSAEVRKRGVVLRWTPLAGGAATEIRLHRTLLTPPPAKTHESLLAPPPEPLEENLLVPACAEAAPGSGCRVPDRALDTSIRFGESYTYRAQRVTRVPMGKPGSQESLELDGPLSAPVSIVARNVFPPAVPTDLAAVATAGTHTAGALVTDAIDLNWQPVADADLAGYIVYRRENGTNWQRISPAPPSAAPAFHDARVLPGHTYQYEVSAVGRNGYESPRSIATQETVPAD